MDHDTESVASPKELFCHSCNGILYPEYIFCPACGRQVREKAYPISFFKQIGIYVLSLVLPLFGIMLALRYLTSYGTKSKVVGGISLVLTIISFIIITYLVMTFLSMIAPLLQSTGTLSEL